MAGNQSLMFHRFPDLPRELRDAIWELCLPHRIVEVDFPNPLQRFIKGHESDYEPHISCTMHHTTKINSAPPIITRVCREARMAALFTGRFVLHSTAAAAYQPSIQSQWVDRARDTLHLHWDSFSHDDTGQDHWESIRSMSFQCGAKAVCIMDDLLDTLRFERRVRIMHMLENWRSVSICSAVVAIHVADETAAIESGLFGALGEERIALVDVSDVERLGRFRAFWQEHGEDDFTTKAFFDACVDGVPKIHYVETPDEFLLDLEIRWLVDSFFECGNRPLSSLTNNFSLKTLELGPLEGVWLTEPADLVIGADDPGFGDLPGRPLARQIWEPNRDHPWVKDVLSRMPTFQIKIMMRLCTDDCRRTCTSTGHHQHMVEG